MKRDSIHKLIRPQGFQGCLKMRQGPLSTPFEVWCNNIAPKLKNIQNTLRKHVFFDIFFNFDDFLKFVPFGGNLRTKTQQFYFFLNSNFLTPLGSLGAR